MAWKGVGTRCRLNSIECDFQAPVPLCAWEWTWSVRTTQPCCTGNPVMEWSCTWPQPRAHGLASQSPATLLAPHAGFLGCTAAAPTSSLSLHTAAHATARPAALWSYRQVGYTARDLVHTMAIFLSCHRKPHPLSIYFFIV